MDNIRANFLKVKMYDYKNFVNLPVIKILPRNLMSFTDIKVKQSIEYINENYVSFNRSTDKGGFVSKFKNKFIKVLFNYSTKQIEFNRNIKEVILYFNHNIEELIKKISKLQFGQDSLKVKIEEQNSKILELEKLINDLHLKK